MKAAVTISLVGQARGGPFVFWDDIAAGCQRAAALGFHAVEIFAPSASAFDRAGLRTLLDQHGLEVAAFGTGAGWVAHQWQLCHAKAEVRAQALEFIRQMIELAASFGAPAIIGSMQGRADNVVSREEAIDLLGAALNELGEHAARQLQPLLFEPLNRYETNLFNRLGDTATFLHTLKTRNVKLLADLFHMNIEEASIADALRAVRAMLGHVHFADSNRRAVGLGHTDMEPIMKALREIGYTGYLSAEILPLPDAETAALQTFKSYTRWTKT